MPKNCTACADLCSTLPWRRVALRTIAQILKQQRKHFRQTDGGAHCANMQFLFKILTAKSVFIRILMCVHINHQHLWFILKVVIKNDIKNWLSTRVRGNSHYSNMVRLLIAAMGYSAI